MSSKTMTVDSGYKDSEVAVTVERDRRAGRKGMTIGRVASRDVMDLLAPSLSPSGQRNRQGITGFRSLLENSYILSLSASKLSTSKHRLRYISSG
jgi:hypothetical protein